MKNMGYHQCKMVRKTRDGETTLVSFIPAQFARLGEYLRLKEEAGEWTDGWQVMSVGEFSTNPPDWRRAIRKHRDQTGDSLPKVKKDEAT